MEHRFRGRFLTSQLQGLVGTQVQGEIFNQSAAGLGTQVQGEIFNQSAAGLGRNTGPGGDFKPVSCRAWNRSRGRFLTSQLQGLVGTQVQGEIFNQSAAGLGTQVQGEIFNQSAAGLGRNTGPGGDF